MHRWLHLQYFALPWILLSESFCFSLSETMQCRAKSWIWKERCKQNNFSSSWHWFSTFLELCWSPLFVCKILPGCFWDWDVPTIISSSANHSLTPPDLWTFNILEETTSSTIGSFHLRMIVVTQHSDCSDFSEALFFKVSAHNRTPPLSHRQDNRSGFSYTNVWAKQF